MPTRDDLIADRYQLLEQLGVGGMGEVWKAQDTRFESRLVAVKLLREDETLREDARNRDRFLRAFDDESRGGDLTLTFIVNAIDDVLTSGRGREQLRARITSAVGTSQIDRDAAARVFDALVDDPGFNDNARLRAKLRKLFRDEANSVANLRHENIVSISDYGDHRGVPFLAMEYIEGYTLSRIIQRGAPVPRPRQLRWMEDLCAGLGYAHQKFLVHRDIKPANLIIDAGSDRLKVLDFGVVRRLEHAGETTMGTAVGTFCYMSPEQALGSAALDHRSDIFSVGAVFYELLSGRKAFPPSPNANELLDRIQRQSPEPLAGLIPGIESDICRIVERALAKEPEQRFQSMAAMQKDIARIRARLEALEERSDDAAASDRTEMTVVVERSRDTLVLDLLRRAERAYDTGDDHAVVEICDQVLTLKATHGAAKTLRARAVERRAQAARRAEDARLADERARREAEAARLAEEARLADMKRQADEAAREAERVRQAEAARRAEEAKAKAKAAQRAEQARLAEVAQRAAEKAKRETEAARLAEEARLADMKRQADEAAREAERVRQAEAAREAAEIAAREAAAVEARAEAARRAEEARRRAEEKAAREAEQARQAEGVRRAEEARLAEAKRQADEAAREAERVREAEAARQAAEIAAREAAAVEARAEAARRAEEARRRAEEKAAREAEQARQAEGVRRAEEARLAEAKRQADEAAREAEPLRQADTARVAEPVVARPSGSPRGGSTLRNVGLAVAAASVLAVVAYSVRTSPQPAAAGTTASPTVPPVPSPTPQVVSVNILPWARVRIVSQTDGVSAPDGPFITPFTVSLQPGRYRLVCENDGLSPVTEIPLAVDGGVPVSITETMAGFSADAALQSILGGQP